MMSSHSKRPTPSSSKRPTTGSSSSPLPIDDAHQIRQSPVFGSNRRSVKPSKPGRPGKSGALYVSTFPSPPTIGCATEKASNSIHSSSPGTSGFDALAVRDLPRAEEEVEVVPAVVHALAPLRPMIEPAA